MKAMLRVCSVGLALATAACAGDDSDPMGETDDGICRIVWLEQPTPSLEVFMTDDTREVTVSRAQGESREIYTFDAEGRLVRSEYEGIPLRAATDFTYDARGHMTAAMTFGEPGDACTNSYDDSDRIDARDCSQANYTYSYDDGDRMDGFTTEPEGGSVKSYTVAYEGNVTTIESDDSAAAFTSDSEGRLITEESDWVFGSGKDGTFDIRWTWTYRASGGVSRLEQDGTHHADNPVIDGTPDLTWTFSPSCDAIGAVHPWIYSQDALIDVGHPLPSIGF